MEKQFDLVGVFGGHLMLLEKPTGKWDYSKANDGALWERYEGCCATSLYLENETQDGQLSIEILIERKVGCVSGNAYIKLSFYNQTYPPLVFEANNLDETLAINEIFNHQ